MPVGNLSEKGPYGPAANPPLLPLLPGAGDRTTTVRPTGRNLTPVSPAPFFSSARLPPALKSKKVPYFIGQDLD
jgi:hypothetical protein